MTQTRRRFISRIAAALGLAALSPKIGLGQEVSQSKTRLILLGTGGGPRPRANSFASSQVIIINGAPYVVDCGDGVATQLVRAGVRLASIRDVLITHHHSDHNADYGNLLLLAWTAGLETRVDTWGPPPLKKINRLFFEMSDVDIRTRIADEGRSPIAPLIHPHEIVSGGPVFKDEHVTVTCAVVQHPMIKTALAYRFDTRDRSIVISGDTAKSDALIALAKGADVLVHEAMYLPGVDRLAARAKNATTIKKHFLASHTSAEDAGRVAAAAGVKTLVLSHFVPADDPQITEQMWRDSAKTTFSGQIIVGRDLLEI
ncbi:MAG: MBL fold metallo-hydrolase [Acidobacteriota bacterium]